MCVRAPQLTPPELTPTPTTPQQTNAGGRAGGPVPLPGEGAEHAQDQGDAPLRAHGQRRRGALRRGRHVHRPPPPPLHQGPWSPPSVGRLWIRSWSCTASPLAFVYPPTIEPSHNPPTRIQQADMLDPAARAAAAASGAAPAGEEGEDGYGDAGAPSRLVRELQVRCCGG